MDGKPAVNLEVVLDRCRPGPGQRPNILQTLLAVQEVLGHVPVNAVGEIARRLEVTDADVAGVLSYYPDLRTNQTGRHLIRLCMGESCVANHCSRILRELRDQLRVDVGETTPGNRFTLERVSCVGNCAVSPTVIIDDDLYGRMIPSQVSTMLENYK
jgi:NADH:ubiquinone oxidoreductase subunit E